MSYINVYYIKKKVLSFLMYKVLISQVLTKKKLSLESLMPLWLRKLYHVDTYSNIAVIEIILPIMTKDVLGKDRTEGVS